MNRELDLKIAKEVMNWNVYEHVGPDAFGENECDVLVPHKGYLQHMAAQGYTPPVKGKIPEGFFVPQYSSHLSTAIDLARFVKLPLPIWELPSRPEEIAWLCYEHFGKPSPSLPADIQEEAVNLYPEFAAHTAIERAVVRGQRAAYIKGYQQYAGVLAERDKEIAELKRENYELINIISNY